MFISWRTYTATAGFSTQLEYVCALCGTRAVASVQAQGIGTSTAYYGAGGSGDQAAQGAQYAAQANAIGALQHAPCPRCGGYQPIVTGRFQAFIDRVTKAKKRALPIAAAVAGVVLLLGIIPAVRDLKYSSALLVTMILTAISIGAFAFAIFRWETARPQIPWGQVHFWWGRHDGSVGWTPPPHVPAPMLPPPSSAGGLGVGLGIVVGFAALISLGVWSGTYQKIYVVDYKDRPVSVDGIDVTEEAGTYGFDDKHVRKFEARTGQPHKVVIAGVTYPLEGNGSNGWVVAPDAKESDVCFVEYEAIYGGSKSAKPQVNEIALNGNGVIVLSRSYDDAFKDSPKTQEVKSGETRRRWELRTVSCERLEEDKEEKSGKRPGESL